MRCTSPLTAWDYGSKTPNGKVLLEWSQRSIGNFITEKEIVLSCGQCMACRLRRSASTAVRSTHEAYSFENNMFITLTVAPEYMDEVFPNGSLDHAPWQKFMKRFRKKYQGIETVIHPKKGTEIQPIRALMCGEYGGQKGRPHYHACIYNFKFDDLEVLTLNKGYPIYTSKKLSELWQYGYVTIGELNFESSAYLARYVTKKITGKDYDSDDPEVNPYMYIDEDTGCYEKKKQEYIVFPSGYGLGEIFAKEHLMQIYAEDFVRSGKRKMAVPRYYDKLLEKENLEVFENVKKKRIASIKDIEKISWQRLRDLDDILHYRVESKLPRRYEEDGN